MLPPFEEFRTDLGRFMDMWRLIDVRVLAVEEPGQGWLCDRLVVMLLDQKMPRPRHLPDVDGLLVRHQALRIEQFSAFLETISSGELRVGQDTVHLRQNGPGPDRFEPITAYSARWRERQASELEFGIDAKTLALEAWASLVLTGERHRRLDAIAARLRDADPPWDGLPHLRTTFLRLNPEEMPREDIARVEILAPLPLRLGERTSVRGNRCTVQPEFANTVKVDDIAAALFGFDGGTIAQTQRVSFSRRRGRTPRGVMLPRRFDPVRCILTYRGFSIETRDLYQDQAKIPGAKWAAFHAIVGEPEELQAALARNRGDPLEHTVATLLHLMGLSVAHYSRNAFSRGGDMADIAAFDEGGNVVVLVECTARSLDPGSEIARLATRAREIQKRMPQTTVQPVFWTQQARSDLIQAALEVAVQEEVAVVTLDDVAGLIAVASATPSAARAVQALRAFIPRRAVYS